MGLCGLSLFDVGTIGVLPDKLKFVGWVSRFAVVLSQGPTDITDWSSKDDEHSMVRSDQCLDVVLSGRQVSNG